MQRAAHHLRRKASWAGQAPAADEGVAVSPVGAGDSGVPEAQGQTPVVAGLPLLHQPVTTHSAGTEAPRSALAFSQSQHTAFGVGALLTVLTSSTAVTTPVFLPPTVTISDALDTVP